MSREEDGHGQQVYVEEPECLQQFYKGIERVINTMVMDSLLIRG